MDRRQWKEPCDEHIVAEGVHIERGAVVRITRGRQLLLYVQAGTVWLTQERDRRDIVADAGRWFRIDSDGLALISALEAANVTLSAPLNAPPRWQIEQLAAGGQHAGLRVGAAKRRHPRVRAFWASWLRLYRAGRRSMRRHWRAQPALAHVDARTLKDIGMQGIRGRSFAERADHFRWRHDIHFGLRGDSFL